MSHSREDHSYITMSSKLHQLQNILSYPFKNEDCGSIQERTICHITMSSNPATVCSAPDIGEIHNYVRKWQLLEKFPINSGKRLFHPKIQ